MYERVPSPAGRSFAGQYRAEIATRYCPALNEVHCKSINISAYERPTPSPSTCARTSGREDGNTRRPPPRPSVKGNDLHTLNMAAHSADGSFLCFLKFRFCLASNPVQLFHGNQGHDTIARRPGMRAASIMAWTIPFAREASQYVLSRACITHQSDGKLS